MNTWDSSGPSAHRAKARIHIFAVWEPRLSTSSQYYLPPPDPQQSSAQDGGCTKHCTVGHSTPSRHPGPSSSSEGFSSQTLGLLYYKVLPPGTSVLFAPCDNPSLAQPPREPEPREAAF